MLALCSALGGSASPAFMSLAQPLSLTALVQAAFIHINGKPKPASNLPDPAQTTRAKT